MEADGDVSGVRFTFIWSIPKFSGSLDQKHVHLFSPPFLVRSLFDTEWGLCLGRKEPDTNSINCNLFRLDEHSTSEVTEIGFELSVLGEDGSPLSKEKKFIDPTRIRKFDRIEFILNVHRDEILGERKKECPANDTLTFRCQILSSGSTGKEPEICFACTKVEEEHASFCKSLGAFSTLEIGHKRSFLMQPKFHAHPSLSLAVFCTKNEDGIAIDITASDVAVSFRTIWKISLIDVFGRVVAFEECTWYTGERFRVIKIELLRKEAGSKESLGSANNTLILKCDCTKYYSNEIVIDSQAAKGTKNNKIELGSYRFQGLESTADTLSQDLKHLYKEGLLCDVNLLAGTEKFPAHRALLSARSPVFRDMFISDIKENTRIDIYVPDLETETLRQLLHYIYTDTLLGLHWEGAVALYIAADKYKMISLRNRCSFFLKANLSVSNACEILCMSNMHHDEDLKHIVKEFFLHQGAEIFRSDKWKKFRNEFPHLASETAEYVYLQKIGN